MPTVVGVRLRNAAKALWFDPAEGEYSLGAHVIVRTDRGEEIGTITLPAHELDAADLSAPLKPVLRAASDTDLSETERLADLEAKGMSLFREMVKERRLDMKPVDVEYLFDGSKAVFYFVAEERVDFRDLVKDLTTKLKTRVDMRQVGVRDEARMVGGVGHCGQPLCCVRFGGEFQPVSIRMAKEQDLPLNPLKISGLCGRLMCCLRYEYDAYKDFKTRAPKRGAQIETPTGTAKVTDLNTPKEVVTMRLGDGTEIKVPLGDMECCSGKGCPCSVSAEAIEAARGKPLVSPMTDAASLREASPAPSTDRPSEGRGRSRRGGRGGRGSGGGAGAGTAEARAGDKPKQGGRQQQGSGAKARPKADKPEQGAQKPPASGDQPAAQAPRKRRRRRPRGGGGAAGGGTPAAGV